MAFQPEYEARLRLSSSPSPKPRRGGSSIGSGVGIARRSSAENSYCSPKTKTRYSDRFIPSRVGSSDLAAQFSLDDTMLADHKEDSTYSQLLKTELLGTGPSTAAAAAVAAANAASGGGGGGSQSSASAASAAVPIPGASGGGGHSSVSPVGSPLASPSPQPRRNLLRYQSSPDVHSTEAAFSLSPMSPLSQRLLASPKRTPRKIARAPYKILEAPAIVDDFYLNLLDWSALNVIAVGLGSCVYLWNALTGQVSKLCDVGIPEGVTSVSWSPRGTHLALGLVNGQVQVWDAQTAQSVLALHGHRGRVSALTWNATGVTSGSRDHLVMHRDVREWATGVSTAGTAMNASQFIGHKQEVCGLRWSPDEQVLASGGNDNKLLLWSAANASAPMSRFCEHKAAVKAIAWSPHQRGLLASGGGTADRCIRVWNTASAASVQSVDTLSQVCNLAWSKNVNELVSTHGYSQNQVVVWSYPSLTPIATLTGHSMRVLYLAVSPDGQNIVTGAGDESLRFWNVFPPPAAAAAAADQSMFRHADIR